MELANRPDIQRNLQNASIEVSEVRKEILRLWPPSWLFARDALVQIDVAGHRLPRGSHILISSWVLHRTTAWDDAMAFAPERWAEMPPPNAYIPYGAGKRFCMGANFANGQIDAFLGVLRDKRIFPAGAAVYGSIDDRATLVPVGLKFRVGSI
ncbi:cytochrome P450 [Nocardioides zeae]|uniref:Cytochrome P450 n=1 Tax=Nocardioides zeae TaxID=1457234 RepID=A0AAJ1X132_9ACTN|nr:cytochrome P450 [Nocardioides zeae]MDQ1103759.1 cytochrome P450 [Nocardioides zeae]